ncbi:hypothetical protein [Streptomyces cyaneofuscatus]|uniref:hypothetical protein n=1 Tax=Streptomyces cyaneofuscatus TaxID=66883 RepID=UPI0036D8DECB
MSADEITTSTPTYADCFAVRITPYADGAPDHGAATTFHFETPVMLGHAYRTRQPALDATGRNRDSLALPGLVGFTTPDNHPDPRTLTPFARALYPERPGAPLAIDAWSKAAGGEPLYLLVPQWHRRPLDEEQLRPTRHYHLFALGQATPTTQAHTWPRTSDGEYHVEGGIGLYLTSHTSPPPAASAPAPTIRTTH